MKHAISRIRGREILDSRGEPTLEVEVSTEGGAIGRAAVPSGLSRGRHEAFELRDGGRRYHGRGVLTAVASVNEAIAPHLIGEDVREQLRIDNVMIELDGTPNKSRLGANAILGVSLACAKAAAESEGEPLYRYIGGEHAGLLPIPLFNLINGGLHAGNDLEFQEFIVLPEGAESLSEALRIGSEVYHELRRILASRYGKAAVNVGDEGGFSPPMSRPEEALEAISEAVSEAGYADVTSLALDAAASNLYEPGKGYTLMGRCLDRGELLDYYRELVEKFHLVSLEDPFHDEDFEGFSEARRALSIQIVGDDLFATNPDRLRMGIEAGAADALLLKVNQIGTLSEALLAARMAGSHNYKVIASHRSGDTEDTFIADLAVGIGCGQIKAGAPCRGERTAKYNRLLRIEEELESRARYPRGLASLKGLGLQASGLLARIS